MCISEEAEILNDQDNKMDTAAAAAAQAYGENATSGVGQSAVDKICRLCCAEGQAELSLLFPDGSSYEANKLLLKKIYECTTVQVSLVATLWNGQDAI